MNKLFSPARSAFVASVWGVMGLLANTGAWAQTAAPTTSNRQADFIVAVVNSEPITNRDVQVLRQRLANGPMPASSRGWPWSN